MEGWYKDKDCKTAQGNLLWYYPNKVLKSLETYVNGVKEGTSLKYNETGNLVDSANYIAGRQKGIRLQWNAEGMLVDSSNFDGAGNGVELSWNEDGSIYSAGYWVSDTIKKGRWKYYEPDGKMKATEDYVEGKRIACNCFDAGGQPLDSAACSEKEAQYPGGIDSWRQFLADNLHSYVPVNMKAPLGQYTVVAQFIIDTDGTVSNIKPLTLFGFGMEDEVIRTLKKSPRWVPARQFGRKVKAYRKQPITFVVSNR